MNQEKTWAKFFIRTGMGTDDSPFAYVTYAANNADRKIVVDSELMGNTINGKEVWRYEAGGDAIWHYGVRINFDGTSYKLADGGEAVTINTGVRPVLPTATVNGTTYTFEDFFVVNTTTNKAYIFDPFEIGKTVEVTSFNHKPLDLIAGVTTDGTLLWNYFLFSFTFVTCSAVQAAKCQ